jgi:formyl-CoA transferase
MNFSDGQVLRDDSASVRAERRPLGHIRVLDLTHARAGPIAVRQLSDWGADVWRIERKVSDQINEGLVGRRSGADFQNLHRSKRSLSLDLKSAEGKQIFLELVKKADVLIENMRPDVKYRLGVDYATLSEVNPKLVYGSISGYGQDGPYGHRGGVDQIAQGISGFMSVNGIPGQGPLRVGIAIADITTGMFLAQGVLTGLVERQVSGRGTWVKTSLLQSMIAMMDNQAIHFLSTGKIPTAVGNEHPFWVPMGTYPAKDGHYINIAASTQRLFRPFCEVTGLQPLLAEERFSTPELRKENSEDLRSIVSAKLLEKTAAEWIEILNAAGVPCGPVLNVKEVFDDPQVKHLNVTRSVDHRDLGAITVLASPIDIEGASKDPIHPVPEIGEQSRELLREAGYSDDQITGFDQRGII